MRGIIIKKKNPKNWEIKAHWQARTVGGKKKKKSLQEKLKKKEKKVSILIWFITEKKIVWEHSIVFCGFFFFHLRSTKQERYKLLLKGESS